jgi:hypothetical protein
MAISSPTPTTESKRLPAQEGGTSASKTITTADIIPALLGSAPASTNRATLAPPPCETLLPP